MQTRAPQSFIAELIAPTVELDPQLNEERKRREAWRLNVVVNPLYRLIAFYALAAAILLHNRFLLHALTPETATRVLLLFGLYPLVAWATLYTGFARLPWLSTLFLMLDILFLDLTIYFSGGERSLLFLAPLFRVVDQTHTTFKRAMFFGHAALAGYVGLYAWMSLVEHRSLDWPAEAVKGGFLYSGILYTALTARAADGSKRRTSEAIGLARASISSLEESSESLRLMMHRTELILESVGEGVVGFDMEGKVTFANRRASRTIGLDVEELVGRRAHELAVHCGEDGRVCDGTSCPLEAALRSGIEAHGENAGFLRKDGSTVPVAYTSSPVFEHDQLTGAVFSFRDITDRKHFETALRVARDEAEAASNSKSAFLANMSHELRTPLNAIIGFSEMLGDDVRDDGNSTLASDALKIETAGKRLLSMITDILDIAKLEAGRLQASFESVDVAALLHELSSQYGPRFEARGNLLELSTEPVGDLVSDHALLRRILNALLDNANKFSEKATTRLQVSRETDGEAAWVAFRIADQGTGMPEEQMKALFEPFTAGGPVTTKSTGGAGIGLALSKRMANAVGATLQVRSDVGRGSEFTLRVPAAGSPTPAVGGH